MERWCQCSILVWSSLNSKHIIIVYAIATVLWVLMVYLYQRNEGRFPNNSHAGNCVIVSSVWWCTVNCQFGWVYYAALFVAWVFLDTVSTCTTSRSFAAPGMARWRDVNCFILWPCYFRCISVTMVRNNIRHAARRDWSPHCFESGAILVYSNWGC